MQIYTVFDFHRDFIAEMSRSFGLHNWVFMLAAFILLFLFLVQLHSPQFAGGIAVVVVMPLILSQVYGLYNAVKYGEQRVNEMVHTAYLEHQEEIDKGIDESLAKHDLTRDEVCNHSTVLDSLERESVDANKTLLCGNDADSALPGMFIPDNRDVVVHVGEAEGKVVVIYKPEDNLHVGPNS